MMDLVLFHERPFRHFHCLDVFADDVVADAKEALGGPLPWETRVGEFYVTYRLDLRRCFEQRGGRQPAFVEPEFLLEMRDRMAEMFGEPLSDDIQVLGHRMAPDQAIGVHNDNPGLGYENYRVIVQFTESHEEDDGGLLNLHASDRPEDIFQTVAPFPNMGFGFEMGAGSFHSVTAVKRKDRMALIFNFWHVGNTPAVERAVNEALTDAGIAMGDPPRKADPVADARDTAALLRHWGEPDSVVAEGFREVLLDAGGATLTPVVALAHWVVRAPARMFSRELWHRAYAEIEAGRSELTTEARELADLIFPVEVAALEQAQR